MKYRIFATRYFCQVAKFAKWRAAKIRRFTVGQCWAPLQQFIGLHALYKSSHFDYTFHHKLLALISNARGCPVVLPYRGCVNAFITCARQINVVYCVLLYTWRQISRRPSCNASDGRRKWKRWRLDPPSNCGSWCWTWWQDEVPHFPDSPRHRCHCCVGCHHCSLQQVQRDRSVVIMPPPP